MLYPPPQENDLRGWQWGDVLAIGMSQDYLSSRYNGGKKKCIVSVKCKQ
jgi:hypothetical protein